MLGPKLGGLRGEGPEQASDQSLPSSPRQKSSPSLRGRKPLVAVGTGTGRRAEKPDFPPSSVVLGSVWTSGYLRPRFLSLEALGTFISATLVLHL